MTDKQTASSGRFLPNATPKPAPDPVLLMSGLGRRHPLGSGGRNLSPKAHLSLESLSRESGGPTSSSQRVGYVFPKGLYKFPRPPGARELVRASERAQTPGKKETYVIFDGDNDTWACGHMKGWNNLESMYFTFYDGHDVRLLADRAAEDTIRSILWERLAYAGQAIVLIGARTQHLYDFVRNELEICLQLDLPMIAVNLNTKRRMDPDRCPSIMRSAYAAHIGFGRAIIKYALDNFPAEYANRARGASGARHYGESVYRQLGYRSHAVE